MSTIILVDLNDWVGLYLDGKLQLQGHSLSVRDVIEVITGSRPKTIDVDYEAVVRMNYSLPTTLDEVNDIINTGD